MIQIIRLIILALPILAISFHLNAAQCIYDSDTDYVGGAISNDLSYRSANSFQDCCTKCFNALTTECSAWTFTNGFCFFKSSVGNKIVAPGSNYNYIMTEK